MADSDSELWTADQTANYLKITSDALYRLRLSGQGPAFVVVRGRSKYRYRASAVRRWLEQSESTSMAAHNARLAQQRASLAHARKARWPRGARSKT
jgi:hypothetical protein